MEPQIIDAHGHLNFEGFKESEAEVFEACRQAGIWVVIPSSLYANSVRAVALAKKYGQGFFAAIGQHPTHVDDEVFDYEKYAQLIKQGGITAVGECGLDSYRLEPAEKEASLDRQRQLLAQHVRLAKEFDLPVIIHGRSSNPDEIYQQLYQELKDADIRGVLHCYLGSYDAAKPFLDLGYYVSFTGIVTFENAKDIWETAKRIPLDRLMLETDSPYLTPVPHRGKKPNTPVYMEHIVRHVAQLRGMSYDELRIQTVQNARRFFGI